MSLIAELKRRNVFRVGVAYANCGLAAAGSGFRHATDLRAYHLAGLDSEGLPDSSRCDARLPARL